MRSVLAAFFVAVFCVPGFVVAQEAVMLRTAEFAVDQGNPELRAQMPIIRTDKHAIDVRGSWSEEAGARAFALAGLEMGEEKKFEFSSGVGLTSHGRGAFGVATGAFSSEKFQASLEAEFGQSGHEEGEADVWYRATALYQLVPSLSLGVLHQHHEEDFVGLMGVLGLPHHLPKAWFAVSPYGKAMTGLTMVW